MTKKIVKCRSLEKAAFARGSKAQVVFLQSKFYDTKSSRSFSGKVAFSRQEAAEPGSCEGFLYAEKDD